MALFMLMLLIMSIQVTIHGYNIGKHKTGGWNVCFISMRGDKFKKYIKRHDWKKEDNIITKGLDDAKYNSQKLKLKKPNVLMVFSNMELDENTLSKDRWIILKISNDLTELTDIFNIVHLSLESLFWSGSLFEKTINTLGCLKLNF